MYPPLLNPQFNEGKLKKNQGNVYQNVASTIYPGHNNKLALNKKKTDNPYKNYILNQQQDEDLENIQIVR